MTINMEKAYRVFNDYVSDYNLSDSRINLKRTHSIRVARISKQLAQSLQLSNEDILLAELIGLLHDIGRFEQIKRFQTFRDHISIDHGDFGTDILFNDKNGIIRDFLEEDTYDKIISIAIQNHNKATIKDIDTMDEQTLLHCKIIRDSDKIDIFKVINEEDYQTLYKKEDISKDLLTEKLMDDFITKHKVDYSQSSNSVPDEMLCNFAYVFDINFAPSHKMILDNGHLEKLGKRFFEDQSTQLLIQDAHQLALSYCEIHQNDDIE